MLKLCIRHFRVLQNATNSNELLGVPSQGFFIGIIKTIQKAEIAANQSREAADEALKVTLLLLILHDVFNQMFICIMLIEIYINMTLLLQTRMRRRQVWSTGQKDYKMIQMIYKQKSTTLRGT